MKRSSRRFHLSMITAAGIAAWLLPAGPALAQVPASMRVPVTDPARLEAMGFARGTSNVFELARPTEGTTTLPIESDPDISGPAYFGSAAGFSTAGARTFAGRKSGFGYDCFPCSEDIFNTNPATENFAEAQLDIPNGAVLEFLRTWWDDTNVTHDVTFFLFETCQPSTGPGVPVQTQIISVSSTGSAGAGSTGAGLGNITANSDDCTYRVRARFGNGNLIGPGDNTLAINKARVRWRRQVTPAPATATFTDVPTGHPLFRFVEALVSSGITGGCGGGNYCPDAPLTRGQMAVFLSVALGLNWGF